MGVSCVTDMNDTLANLDDHKLIQRTLDGHQDAFGHLIRKYQGRLYNGIVHIIRDPVEAEDVVQDAFVLALTKLDSFKGNSQFFTWLYRIGYNVAITKLRRKKPTVSIQGHEESFQMSLPDTAPAPSDRMNKQETAQQLMIAMKRISEEHRSILVLREMEEMDYETISQILDLPVGTVRSRLHRARLQLKQQMEIVMGEVDN